MSILKYVRPLKQKSDLPDPVGPLSEKVPSSAISAASKKFIKALDDAQESKKRSRGPYLSLTPAQKYEVGKRAAEHGVTASMHYFAKKYPDLNLKESSVRRFKNAYQEQIKLNLHCLSATEIEKLDSIKELPNKKAGRPLATGEQIDQQVQHYLRELRKKGCVVNTSVAISAGEGILLNKDAALSADCLTKDWAKYLFKRMGLVKRKGNTKAKVQVENFEELKKLFIQDVKTVMAMDEVPLELVISWDQTGLKYVLVSECTMAEEGSKRVEIDGKDDKRQITAVFGCSMAGEFLPPQLVYQGKTTKCLPAYKFPQNWSITYTANHWCNEDNMELYIHNIILPYLTETRSKLKLPYDHPALLLFDNFKGQCTEKLLRLLDSSNVSIALIPANCTNRLQPLDLSVNRAAKEFLRKAFQKWYALQVCAQLEGKVPADIRISVMKPLGAKWLVDLYDYLKGKPEIIKNGFKEAGLLECVS